jgi:alanyl-tRNA synthetase
MILASTIRQKYLDFFRSKDHAIIPSAPLVPENDPSVLFNTAGMQPLVPYLLGEPHPLGRRLADVQKCVRTGDIDDVGDDTHLTFFEMLGNWSLGDYFKRESIEMSWEFLTSPEWLALDPEMISVTVFEWNADAPRDEESADIWRNIGMPEDRIAYLPAEDNWWAAGPTGPCGPDTEIFYWMGAGKPPRGSNVGTDPKKWMEIWNNVFMQYNRVDASTLENLPAQCVDTGMGIERCTTVLNHQKSVYHTDCFSAVITRIHEIFGTDEKEGVNWESTRRSARIIADHLRTATHMIADWVTPKNVDQGYILRRLIRRAIREAYKMGYEQPFTTEIASMYIEQFAPIYESVRDNAEKIKTELSIEEGKFSKTLKDGVREFEKIVNGFKIAFERSGQKVTQISGSKAFTLFDTCGFPIEMTLELAKEHDLTVDIDGFALAFEKHQELSRTSAAGKFKWWLADDGVETTALHSACHLMLEWLRQVLGTHVTQAGSNITAERLRFDFTHPEKMTPEQIVRVEEFVNRGISSELTVTISNMDKKEAQAQWVSGSFWEKYPDIVKVYAMVGSDGVIYSRELCGGPHVENSADMGKFRIIKEESSSAGVRRIKAILEK